MRFGFSLGLGSDGGLVGGGGAVFSVFAEDVTRAGEDAFEWFGGRVGGCLDGLGHVDEDWGFGGDGFAFGWLWWSCGG